jgi:hypothetical protein
LLAPSPDAGDARPPRPGLHAALLAAAAAAGLALVLRAWTAPLDALGWRPMRPAIAAALRTCPAPLYNHYDHGGYVLWLVPEVPVYVDSRWDAYPEAFVLAHLREEAEGVDGEVLRARGLGCALVRPWSPTLPRLRAAGWRELAADESWRVLAAGAPTGAAPR